MELGSGAGLGREARLGLHGSTTRKRPHLLGCRAMLIGAAVVLVVALALVDLVLFVTPVAKQLARARWVLVAFPSGAVVTLGLLGPDWLRIAVLVGLPIHAFASAAAFLVTAFLHTNPRAQWVLGVHTALAVVVGALAIAGLSTLDADAFGGTESP